MIRRKTRILQTLMVALVVSSLLIACGNNASEKNEGGVSYYELTGKTVDFTMCGHSISMPREAVKHLTTNDGFVGIAAGRIDKSNISVDLRELAKGINGEVTDSLAIWLICSDHRQNNPRFIVPNLDGYQKTDLPDYGLKKFYKNTRNYVYYFPIEKNSGTDGFYFYCKTRDEQQNPYACRISGNMGAGLFAEIDYSTNGRIDNWRVYKEVFETRIISKGE